MANNIENYKKYQKIIGFDVSENNISAVEIHFSKNIWNVNSGFKISIPVFQDIEKTVSLIKENLKTSNIKTKEIAIGFSMQYFKLFPVSIPRSIPQNEIESILLQEGNINPDENTVSYLPLYSTQRQESDGVLRYDILGISLPRKILDLSVMLSKKCDLKLVSVTPSFLGLGVFLDKNRTNNLISTLWISQLRSEFIVWSGNEPIYEHLFLTHQISDQIFQSVNYIQSQLQGAQITLILTVGPNVNDVNLTQLPYAMQSFPLPTNYQLSKNLQNQIPQSHFITPLGIALSASGTLSYAVPNLFEAGIFKKINFVGKDKVSTGFKDVTQKYFSMFDKKVNDPLLSKTLFISMLIVLFSVFAGLAVKNILMPGILSNQVFLGNKINLVNLQLAKVMNYEKSNKVINTKVEYFSELIDKRKPWSNILREIGDMAPKDLWIDRLEIRGKNIDVFGRALNVDAIANYSINLNYTAKLLSNAQIVALKKFQEEGIDIVEFQVSLKLADITQKIKNKKQITNNMVLKA